MSIDIQKQLDLRPYSDKNVVTKPVAESRPAVQQSEDEEKSNAAKWMIGLTASAAIVLGGLYAAKKGHLGESAEKFAKKLFGEVAKETNPTATAAASTSSPAPAVPTLDVTATPALVLTPLVFARKGISRLIKKPNKTLTEIMTEFEQAGVKLEKKGENLLEIRTGKAPNDITTLSFTPEGTLASIQRVTKNTCDEIFSFENGILRGIKRSYKNTVPEITHEIEFNEAQKVSEESFKFVENAITSGTLKRVNNLNDSYTTGQGCWWSDILGKNYDKLPKELKKAKIFGLPERITNFETAPYITASVSKYYKTSLKDIPEDIPSEDFVRFMHDKTANSFENMVQDLDIARRISQRTRGISDSPILEKTPRNIVEQFAETRIARENIFQNIRELLPNKYSDDTVKAVVKLLEKDMGSAKDIEENIIVHAIRNYTSVLKAHKINCPEHVAIVVKPIKDCSYDEFVEILRQVAPKKAGELGVVQDPWKDREQEQKALMHTIECLTGRSNIKENTSLFDILQDL